MKKRILSLILTGVFLFALASVSLVAADAPPKVYMRHTMNGEKTHMVVEVYTYGLKWTALDLGIKYDPAVMTLQSVSVGSKILKANNQTGVEFITAHREIAKANEQGYCNFVAAAGSATCNVLYYDGPIAVFTFTVLDAAKAKTGYDLCISSLINASGHPLVEYTSFAPEETPVVYLTNEKNPFQYGDLTQNGVDMYDALLVMQYLVDMVELNEYQLYSARVSGSTDVSMYDALLIMQYLVDMIDTFPAEG